MSAISTLTKKAFETFVKSALRQIASSHKQNIIFETEYSPQMMPFLSEKLVNFDAIAPNGFEEINGSVFFEIKYFSQFITYQKLQTILNAVYKKVIQLPLMNVTVVLISNADIDTASDTQNRSSIKLPNKNRVDLIIWDRNKINRLIHAYPIDFSNALNMDSASKAKDEHVFITNNDFSAKSKNNLALLKQNIEKADNFAFVLGAGVSVDPGALSWDQLLAHFTEELLAQKIIDDEKKLSCKIGGSNIITAQLCKELYPNDSDYFWAIHKGLYSERKPINQDYALYHIARIARSCLTKAHFRILTYNYDEYLENYLKNINVKYNTLYDSKADINDSLSIYHVHGFLPEVKAKTHIEKRYQQSIYLTEENYNELYNHPYSWQISSQLSFFRENRCLFVGCSLADPNIRRLLEITKKEDHIHYAILTRSEMTTNDLVKASNHFSRLGIEVIWVDDYKDVCNKLKLL